MQLLHLFLVAEVQIVIPNAYISQLLSNYISPGRAGPGRILGQTLINPLSVIRVYLDHIKEHNSQACPQM